MKILGLIALLSKNLPFSYLWIFDRVMGSNINTVLDLGCGEGNTMHDVSLGGSWEITGIDLHKKSVEQARQSGIYKKVILGDVIKESEKLVKKGQKYDLVFCSQVVEHIEEHEGQKLLGLAEELAKKNIVVTTPNGYVDQHERFIKQNPFHEHKSGWETEDFTKRDYKVYGMGFGILWSGNKLSKIDNKLLRGILMLISYILAPISFYFPRVSAGLIAVKKK